MYPFTIALLFLASFALARPRPRDITVTTPFGKATGVATPSGAIRFSVRYASAQRWSPSVQSTTWQLPPLNPVTGLPLPCPQPGVPTSSSTEDCLAMVAYVPQELDNSNVLVWVHGGSFIVGSASDPLLDGSLLATATRSVVVVIQYRLGALGFMAPSGLTNLAVKDVINGLSFIRSVSAAFGGNNPRITLAGQSSGANLIRALLAVPSADGLFQGAILESDPMDFGFLSTTTQQKLQQFYNGQIGCAATDTACQAALSVDAIINAELTLFGAANSIDPSAGQSEPWRPVRDGVLITSPLTSSAPFPHVSKPVIITTVTNEAAELVFAIFPNALPGSQYRATLDALLGPMRGDTVAQSALYPPPPASASDVRPQVETVGTDFAFRCAAWTFARSWVANGGTAFVGVYRLGSAVPQNQQIPFCLAPGHVCHQDDIPIVFGTAPNPTSAQSALISEVQRRYRAFMRGGNPNAAGLPTWRAATSGADVRALNLGATGEAPVGGCDPAFWGALVPFDYQVFGI